MNNSKQLPKPCPPFMISERFRDKKNIFVVTVSAALSGTYNSAMQAKAILQEEFKDRFIHVLDSMTAARRNLSFKAA